MKHEDIMNLHSNWQVVYCCSDLQPDSLIIITTLLWRVNGNSGHMFAQMIMMCALLHQKRPMNLVGVYQQQQTVTGLQVLFTSYCLVIIYFFDRSTKIIIKSYQKKTNTETVKTKPDNPRNPSGVLDSQPVVGFLHCPAKAVIHKEN